jgi:iron(III) transport system ATP-binding protein
VRLREEIRTLQQSLGVTTIMVTHDQEEALSMADRIVVMNHGCIEQVGTPTEIYREPASAFVADFVGQVNVLPGTVTEQTLHLGEMRIPLSDMPSKAHAQGDVKVYLRPEDVLARPILAGDACVFQATIQEVEFLGAFCHVHVMAPAISTKSLTVYLSLNYLAEHQLQAGSTLALKLMPERIKLF